MTKPSSSYLDGFIRTILIFFCFSAIAAVLMFMIFLNPVYKYCQVMLMSGATTYNPRTTPFTELLQKRNPYRLGEKLWIAGPGFSRVHTWSWTWSWTSLKPVVL
jgi:hypothetical protein